MQIIGNSKRLINRIISTILSLVMIFTGTGIVNLTKEINADNSDVEMITLYFVDSTSEKWVKNNEAIVQLVDNTNGHNCYDMNKVNENLWSVAVPASANNITFNRLSTDKSTQWNSWSAGGRDGKNAYYAEGAEYGHWGILENANEGFHAGDVIYLDLTEFTSWTNENSVMYVNFTEASKEQNYGNDITISNADSSLYNPKTVTAQTDENVYSYTVTSTDEGAANLRFWRGNSTTLWNYSIVLSYTDYAEGLNCIKVSGWNDEGTKTKRENLNFDEDYLIVNNAINKLKIEYNGSDSEYSVTENLILPETLDGATIEWSSSNTDIVSNGGIVTRPDETSIKVQLTATVRSNAYFETKSFEVYVIKSKYVNYNTDYIQDLDSLELLYLYNEGDIDNLEVYINENGYIDYIMGSFSDIIVESPQEAILALYSIKTLMGCSSPKDELSYLSTNKDEYGASFRFEQVYQGIPVYGRDVVVSTDSSGLTTTFKSSFVSDIDINTTPTLSSEEAEQKLIELGYKEIQPDKLYIYVDSSVPKLAWNLNAKTSEGMNCNVLLDAINGQILLENLSPYEQPIDIKIGTTTGTGVSELGTTETFSVSYIKNSGNTRYNLADFDRNIWVYDFGNVAGATLSNSELASSSNNSWNAVEVSAMSNVKKAYDFYNNNFGRKGFDNKNSKISVIINDVLEVANSGYSKSNDSLNFGHGGSYIHSGAAALDTVGHEFTHGVVKYTTSLGSCYYNAPGAINEGYADIFGYFIEGDDDAEWLHREDNTNNARAIRNMSNPAEFRQPSAINDEFYQDYNIKNDDNGGVHRNNTIVSHACYLMWNNGITDKTKLAKLWYHSLLKGYDSSSEFYSVRENVLAAAKDMRMSGEEIQIIKDAFNAVGILGRSKADIEGTNILTGKVVEADMDAIIGNNLPLSDVAVSIIRTGEHLSGMDILTAFKSTTTSDDGTFYFNNIVPGTYVVTMRKSGYYTATQTITLTSTNLNNYCSTVELIPDTYTGTGQASGKIVDSVTGAGVEGLELKIRKGINTKTGTVVGQTETQSNGMYMTPLLNTGHYCIEVTDSRELENETGRYYKTYFNIKILGGVVISNQNATVSNSLDGGQLRIVLEWGELPTDLDSHLIGPTSSGGTFHIYYRDKVYSENGTIIADLDLDDVTSYGPETTTIYNPVEGEYTFYVYNYSGSPSMSESGASIKVYSGDANEPKYVFNIPTDQTGRYWTVFTYNSKTRKITPVNVVGNNILQ